jgi:glyoxylate/hydroxypyruvate reductase
MFLISSHQAIACYIMGGNNGNQPRGEEMKINHILVVSPMYKQVQELILQFNIQKEFQFLREEELATHHLEWADALVCFNLKGEIDYSRVKWVHSLGAGVDRFLYGKSWDKDVLLTRTICSFGQRIAEYCLSYILKDLQCHDFFKEAQSAKKWKPVTPKLLSDQKVLIYGTGEIGQKVAQILSSFGVEVYGVSQSGTTKEFFKEVKTIDGHYSLLGSMDYLINTLPLTDQTAHLFSKEIFGQVSGIGFMNVGRGATVDEEALIHALNQNQVRFAVLDVFAGEPLAEENPLWSHPKIYITPHISAVTTPDEGVACFVETLRDIEHGNPLKNQVNIEKGY